MENCPHTLVNGNRIEPDSLRKNRDYLKSLYIDNIELLTDSEFVRNITISLNGLKNLKSITLNNTNIVAFLDTLPALEEIHLSNNTGKFVCKYCSELNTVIINNNDLPDDYNSIIYRHWDFISNKKIQDFIVTDDIYNIIGIHDCNIKNLKFIRNVDSFEVDYKHNENYFCQLHIMDSDISNFTINQNGIIPPFSIEDCNIDKMDVYCSSNIDYDKRINRSYFFNNCRIKNINIDQNIYSSPTFYFADFYRCTLDEVRLQSSSYSNYFEYCFYESKIKHAFCGDSFFTYFYDSEIEECNGGCLHIENSYCQYLYDVSVFINHKNVQVRECIKGLKVLTGGIQSHNSNQPVSFEGCNDLEMLKLRNCHYGLDVRNTPNLQSLDVWVENEFLFDEHINYVNGEARTYSGIYDFYPICEQLPSFIKDDCLFKFQSRYDYYYDNEEHEYYAVDKGSGWWHKGEPYCPVRY